MADSDPSLMSDVFRPYEKLVEITILGKTFLVPERNSLLRAFQFISPETIPYGRFCWNQECQYCRVNCQLSDDDRARPILSCKFIVSEGMDITQLSPELVGCLRTKLGIVAPPSSSFDGPNVDSDADGDSDGDAPAGDAANAAYRPLYLDKAPDLKP